MPLTLTWNITGCRDVIKPSDSPGIIPLWCKIFLHISNNAVSSVCVHCESSLYVCVLWVISLCVFWAPTSPSWSGCDKDSQFPISLSILGVVSLTFRELSKIISRKYITPEITFTARISSWNFVRVPKAWLWAHVQSFSLKFSSRVLFLQCTNFERIFWRARETLVKQSPGPWQACHDYLL